MFYIYSINIDDLALQLYDFCHTEETIDTLLDRVAKKFILREAGERRAESPYCDDTPNVSITDDGYFLRHSDKPQQIDVYHRKTSIHPGHVWNSFDVSCKKVMYFAVVETPFELSIQYNVKNNDIPAKPIGTFVPELKTVLVNRRMIVDKQIECEPNDTNAEIEDSNSESDLDSDVESDPEQLENPIVRLRRRIAQNN